MKMEGAHHFTINGINSKHVIPESFLNQLTQDKVHEYKEAFNMYDKDHDGILSVQKLGAVLRALGHNPTEIEIQEMIDEIDSEGTGFIDFESFFGCRHEP